MCGRYTLHVANLSELKELLGILRVLVPDWKPRYNVAPTQDAPVVVVNGSERELQSLRWGLIPPWAESAAIGARSINARVETVAELRSFKRPFVSRRCVVPATGYFEWKTLGTKAKSPKQPMWIHPRDGVPLAFAGVWETWHAPDGEEVESFAIVTTEAQGDLRQVHDRMPLELRGDAIEAWLRPGVMSGSALNGLVQQASVEHFEVTPVDTRVGSPFNDDPGCIAPPSEDRAGARQLDLFE